jgi:membrane protease YdiL (CAAX protease family)
MMKPLLAYNPNLLQSWGLLGLFLICQLIVGMFAGIIPLIFGPAAESWLGLSAYVISFIIMGLVVIRLGKEQEQTEISAIQRFKSTFLLYVLLLFLTPLLSVSIEPLYMWIPMPQFIEEFFFSHFTVSINTFLLAVIAAPLAEEWLCRGIILKGLLTNRVSPYKAIFWSALLFAIMHLNPWQAIPAFCIGFVMGWVYWRTRSLWLCIFMHAVNNGLAFTTILIFPDAPVNTTLHDVAGPHYLYVYMGAVTLSIAIGYGLWRMVEGKSKA